MDKRIKTDELVSHIKINECYTWGEIQDILKNNNIVPQDNDKIMINYNTDENKYNLCIVRKRLETNEELAERISHRMFRIK